MHPTNIIIMVRKYDFLVIGSGIAGMSFAMKVAHKGRVALICKAGLEEANTYFAQGGIASVTNLKVDNFEKHIEDTMIAGDWISDRNAVEKVVREAPTQIEELINWGVNFDKDDKGNFDLHREGGHSEFRILHHKDSTGAEIQVSLIDTIRKHPNIDLFENHFAIEVLTQHHLGEIITRHTPAIECYGAYILDQGQWLAINSQWLQLVNYFSVPFSLQIRTVIYHIHHVLSLLE